MVGEELKFTNDFLPKEGKIGIFIDKSIVKIYSFTYSLIHDPFILIWRQNNVEKVIMESGDSLSSYYKLKIRLNKNSLANAMNSKFPIVLSFQYREDWLLICSEY